MINKLKIMKDLWDKVKNCYKCNINSTIGENNPHVFIRGGVNSKILVIGQNPGKDEVIQGKPFIGKSGKILNKLLEESGLREKDYLIMNSIFCYTPKNRKPKEEEIRKCRVNYGLKIISIMDPKIIITMGSSALDFISGETKEIMQYRGTWKKFMGKNVFVMLHPASGIYSKERKVLFENDFKYFKETCKKYL